MVYVAHDDEDDPAAGTRKCRGCGLTKLMADFHFTNKRPNRRRLCKTCCHVRAMELRAAAPEKYAMRDRERVIRKKYGLTPEGFDELLAWQDGRCAICREVVALGDARRQPHVDHDHESGVVRGILCFVCNTALGKFGDSVERLQSAIDYLSQVKRELVE